MRTNLLETYSRQLNVAEAYVAKNFAGREVSNNTKLATAVLLDNTNRFINSRLEESVANLVTERLLNEISEMEQQREEREEARFRKLDETIRGRQRGYQEAAAAKLPPYTPTKMNKRHFGLFRK